MALNTRLAIGLVGVPPHDAPRACEWEQRQQWPVLTATLLAIRAFYLTVLSGEPRLIRIG